MYSGEPIWRMGLIILTLLRLEGPCRTIYRESVSREGLPAGKT